jgi:AbrB family transcriptional regulator, transcriptional pleiotropic regulator of transition state genes
MSEGSAPNSTPPDGHRLAQSSQRSTKPGPNEAEVSASRGVIRRIDEVGRVVIPAEYRKVLGINLGDHLDMTLDGSGIVLRRIEAACIFCAAIDELTRFSNRAVCATCRRRLQTGEGL